MRWMRFMWILVLCLCMLTGCASSPEYLPEGCRLLIPSPGVPAQTADHIVVATIQSYKTVYYDIYDEEESGFTIYTATVDRDVLDSVPEDTIVFRVLGTKGEKMYRYIEEAGGYFEEGEQVFLLLEAYEELAISTLDKRLLYGIDSEVAYAKMKNGELDLPANHWENSMFHHPYSPFYDCTTLEQLIERVLAVRAGTVDAYRLPPSTTTTALKGTSASFPST